MITNEDVITISYLILYTSQFQVLTAGNLLSYDVILFLFFSGAWSITDRRISPLWCCGILWTMYLLQPNIVSAILIVAAYWWIEWKWAPTCLHICYYTMCRAPFNFLLYYLISAWSRENL